ncbi:MAG TPA: branched-chain amino acid ABC transporter substrate-binding protein [Burkholderiaceae bacterium]|nr:branched-chain amino acid ABC transporter substrate-binding protein [Burkholderiaceae bacterium]
MGINARWSVLPLVAALSFAMGAAWAEDQEVKIGHVAPLSGGQAHYGKDNERGAMMAIEDLNAKHLKIGGKTIVWKLVSEDDAADPKQGAIVAQKLVDEKVAGVVGHLNSGTTIPASKIYFDAGIPQITPSATNPKYTQQGFSTAFRIIANDNMLGAATALYATKNLKAKTVAIVDDRTAYGQGVADIFEKVAKENGAQVVTRQFTNDKASDFAAILTSIKAAKPDAVFYGGMDAQAGPLIRQAKELGLSAKFLGGDGICTVELPKLGGDAVGDNVICAEGGASLDKMPKGAEFRKRFEEKYHDQIQVYAPYVYDAVFALATAMQKADSVDPAKYLPALKTLQMDGVTSRVSFDSIGELNSPATTLYNYPAGKKTPLN